MTTNKTKVPNGFNSLEMKAKYGSIACDLNTENKPLCLLLLHECLFLYREIARAENEDAFFEYLGTEMELFFIYGNLYEQLAEMEKMEVFFCSNQFLNNCRTGIIVNYIVDITDITRINTECNCGHIGYLIKCGNSLIKIKLYDFELLKLLSPFN